MVDGIDGLDKEKGVVRSIYSKKRLNRSWGITGIWFDIRLLLSLANVLGKLYSRPFDFNATVT
jgi:hypothetical protein